MRRTEVVERVEVEREIGIGTEDASYRRTVCAGTEEKKTTKDEKRIRRNGRRKVKPRRTQC